MGNGSENHEGEPEYLRRQLAIAVRSIRWSYAIFWSLSTTQQGALEWRDGYYNGDIKTRKTIQSEDYKADKIGLRRSEQLRELYKSLMESENDQSAKTLPTVLSPDDLSDAEWYYLVCMSFVFNHAQGLPGRALAKDQAIWLCNAQYAHTKVFSRSLLAKSASIQTVVCFPHQGGVIELGITELVSEDASLLQHVKASLLNLSKPVCSDKSLSANHKADDDKEPMYAKTDNEVLNILAIENLLYSPTESMKLDQEAINGLQERIYEEFTLDSANECSNGCDQSHQLEDSFMVDHLNGEASQVHSWHFADEDFSYGVDGNSMNSSDCISEALVTPGNTLYSARAESVNHRHPKELKSSNDMKSSEAIEEDLRYMRTLFAVLGSSPQSVENLVFGNADCASSFMRWKKGVTDSHKPLGHQNLLNKIMFSVPSMLASCPPNGSHLKSGGNDHYVEHEIFNRRRENDKFMVLRSMVPSLSEIDKESILNDTIIYLKVLKARVQELEACMNSADYEAATRRKNLDMVEQTSDNYDKGKIDGTKKPWLNKRKASDTGETDAELNYMTSKDGLKLDVKVSKRKQEILIDIRCPYREYILLDIMDAINSLRLDAHSVQSSSLDGFLMLTLKSKIRGDADVRVGTVKQVLLKIASKGCEGRLRFDGLSV